MSRLYYHHPASGIRGKAVESSSEWSLPQQKLAAKIADIDLVVSDLDHCIFPGYSQAHLSARIAARIVLRPHTPQDRRQLPRLMRGALCILLYKARQVCGMNMPSSHLVASYEKTMRGVPAYYFNTLSRTLPGRSYPGAQELLCFFSQQAPVGLISLGIEPVCKAYRALFHGLNGPCISFYDANRIVFSKNRGHPVFSSFQKEGLMTNSEDKRTALLRRMQQYRSRCPLVIGNGEDDVLMAEYARECNGFSIGWNPDKKIESRFDLIIWGKTWHPLVHMLKSACQAFSGL